MGFFRGVITAFSVKNTKKTLYVCCPEFRHHNYKLLRPLVLRPNQSLSAYTPCGRIATEKTN